LFEFIALEFVDFNSLKFEEFYLQKLTNIFGFLGVKVPKLLRGENEES
jgi:hypothetical protein